MIHLPFVKGDYPYFPMHVVGLSNVSAGVLLPSRKGTLI